MNILYYQHVGKGVLVSTKISCQDAIRHMRAMAMQFGVSLGSDNKVLEMFMSEPDKYNAVIKGE